MMPPNYGAMFGNVQKTGYAQPNQMQAGYQPNMQTIQPVGNTAIANPVAPPQGWQGMPQMGGNPAMGVNPMQGRIDPRMFMQMMQRQPQQMGMRPQSLLQPNMVR